MAYTLDRSSLRLFGIDLATVPGYLREGWAEALRWPTLRWLTPSEVVRVLRPDGSESHRQGASARTTATGRARFTAVELDEDSLLRRSLLLPRLSEAEIRQTVELDLRAASPFADDDLAWGYSVIPGDRVRVDIALTSRQLVERQIDALRPRLGGVRPEVWAGGERPIIIAGWGEGARQAHESRRRRTVVALLAVGALLLAALAVTPTLQLRETAHDANRKHDDLARAVHAQAQMREELTILGDRIHLLSKAAGQRADVVALLDEVTRQLPDDAVLNRFEINGATVRLSGQADNAAQLLQTLGAKPAFKEVRAPAGIARAPAGGKEGFTIEFRAGGDMKTP